MAIIEFIAQNSERLRGDYGDEIVNGISNFSLYMPQLYNSIYLQQEAEFKNLIGQQKQLEYVASRIADFIQHINKVAHDMESCSFCQADADNKLKPDVQPPAANNELESSNQSPAANNELESDNQPPAEDNKVGSDNQSPANFYVAIKKIVVEGGIVDVTAVPGASDLPYDFSFKRDPENFKLDIGISLGLIIAGSLVFSVGAIAALPVLAASLTVLVPLIAAGAVGASATAGGAIRLLELADKYQSDDQQQSQYPFASLVSTPRGSQAPASGNWSDGAPTPAESGSYYDDRSDSDNESGSFGQQSRFYPSYGSDQSYEQATQPSVLINYRGPRDPSIVRDLVLGVALMGVGATLTTIGLVSIVPALTLSVTLLSCALAGSAVIMAAAGIITLAAGTKLASVGLFKCCGKREEDDYEPSTGNTHSMPEINIAKFQ
jgi:hypothetical protein